VPLIFYSLVKSSGGAMAEVENTRRRP
jgi:hypothetical protein